MIFMRPLERDVRAFVLRALLAAEGIPMQDDVLKTSLVGAYSHVAFTAGDIEGHVRFCERAGWIAGTRDDLQGVVWVLTPLGRIRAQGL